MLINANFTKLSLAYFMSITGEWALKLSIPLYIYSISNSAMLMAISYAISFLPTIFIMPIAGAFVDIVNRKKVLYFTDFIATILSILLFISLFLPTNISLYILFPILFFISTIISIQHPASQAIIAEIVENNSLAKANSYMISIMQFSNIIAPLLGAFLINIVGVKLTVIFNALGFLLSGLIILTIKYQFITSNIKINLKNIANNLKEGFIFTFQHPIIKWATILFTIVNLSTQLIQSNLMFLMVNKLHFATTNISLVFAIQGIAAIIGALMTPIFIKNISKGRFIIFCIFIDAIAITLHLLATNIVILSIVRFLSSFSEAMIVVSMFTLRYEVVSKNMLGKVIGISRPISFISIPTAALLGGYLINLNTNYLIITSSIIMLFSTIIALFTSFNKSNLQLHKFKVN